MENERQQLIYEELKYRKNQYLCEIAKRDFWKFCKLLHPDFYKEDRDYLKKYCYVLQKFYEDKLYNQNGIVYKRLLIQMPPRHGKTRTLILWEQWIFGKNLQAKIITCSYNDDTAYDFSKYVRDGISEEKNKIDQIVYSDIFSKTKIKKGSGASGKWALEGSHFSYKGAGIQGSVTGKGGNYIIIDDPCKSADEAFNELRLEKIWKWYTGTILSRKEHNAKIIITHTPWCAGDLGGRVSTGKGKDDWFVFSKPAYLNGKMLCPDILNEQEYFENKRDMDPLIFSANYDLKIIESKNLLYKSFKTYAELPKDENNQLIYQEKIMFCDTADQGKDFLAAIFGYIINQYFYVTDIYYTQDDISITEEIAAEKITQGKYLSTYIEANSAGHSWAYHVEKILNEKYKWYGTNFLTFTQTKNKQSRIFSRSGGVNERIIFPLDWNILWPEFYHAVMTYQRIGVNKHDDAPDVLTMIIEYIDEGGGMINQEINHNIIPY